jgi:hypothetical protein
MEDMLLREQMDIWSTNANSARLFVCTGRTWFVATDGSDQASGLQDTAPFATLPRGLSAVNVSDDVVLLRAGTYTAPAGNQINTRCTLRATRGPVSVISN